MLAVGIIEGNMLQQEQLISFFLIGLLGIIGIGYMIATYKWQACVLGMVAVLIGCVWLLFSPIQLEGNAFEPGKVYALTGEIKSVRHTQYDQWAILEQVRYLKNNRWVRLKKNIEVRLPQEPIMTENDWMTLRGRCMSSPVQMNPSDFNTPMYLKGQGVSTTFRAEQVEKSVRREVWTEQVQEFVRRRIQCLYHQENRGIMTACLLGDKSNLEQATKTVYNQSGIGHILSISGFHVGVIVGGCLFLLGWLPIAYSSRQWLTLLTVWVYTLFTGCNISTVRAAVMATCLMAGHALWEEADGCTNLSLAAAILLIINPYQLFQVGFQLSFGAVAAILFTLTQIEKKALLKDEEWPKWRKSLVVGLMVQLFIWPILAYYFYEIPFLISVVNLIVMPLFSLIIIGGWLSIFLGSHCFLGVMISKGVEVLLQLISKGVDGGLKFPLATICTGRPSLIVYILYTTAVILIVIGLFGGPIKALYRRTALFVIVCFLIGSRMIKGPLSITALYVGQGDGIVVETPLHQMIIIDGGYKGQGETLEDFIKFRGTDHVAALILSHSDADHISGLIELVQSDLTIDRVFISETDASPLLDQLLALCEERKIKYERLERGESFVIDEVAFNCLAPVQGKRIGGNNASIVAEVVYGRFRALFMGDREYDFKPEIDRSVAPVTLLKVSHHGSRTGTDQALLLKLKPSYAMISCGIDNHYGHPHAEVLEMLQEETKISRTDLEGAISYETDGVHLVEKTFRREVSSCP